MDEQLNRADLALDAWVKHQAKSDEAATRHKHHTAAEIKVLCTSESVSKAKELVIAGESWFKRQTLCDEYAINAQHARMKYDQAVRRWEAARSEFSAGRRVT